MIRVSDNAAASTVYGCVGDDGLHRVARRAGMTEFGVYGYWGNALISAADQARFVARLDVLTRLVPGPMLAGSSRRS